MEHVSNHGHTYLMSRSDTLQSYFLHHLIPLLTTIRKGHNSDTCYQ